MRYNKTPRTGDCRFHLDGRLINSIWHSIGEKPKLMMLRAFL